MGVAKAVTKPIESLISPIKAIKDTAQIIKKPSSLLEADTYTNLAKGQTVSDTAKINEEAERKAKRANWNNTYGDATAFRQMKDAGLKV